MSHSVEFFLQQQLRRHEQNCAHAALAVNRAATMRDVKFSANVIAPSVLRGMPHTRGPLLTLQTHAAKKMEKLLDEQLRRLGEIATAAEMKTMRAHLERNDWIYLRGTYAATYHRATQEATRIIHRKIHLPAAVSGAGEMSAAPDIDSGDGIEEPTPPSPGL